LRTRLLSSLTSSEINQVELGSDNLLIGGLCPRSAFEMDRVNAVRSTGLLVELMSGNGSVCLTLKEIVESFFLILADVQRQSLDLNLSLSIVLYRNSSSLLLRGWHF
jgi:hypothetical protein